MTPDMELMKEELRRLRAEVNELRIAGRSRRRWGAPLLAAGALFLLALAPAAYALMTVGFSIQTSNGAGSDLTRFTIDSGATTVDSYFENCEVGIGTATPAYPLHVKSNAATSNVLFRLENAQSPGAAGYGCQVRAAMVDGSSNPVEEFGRMAFNIADATSGSEDGRFIVGLADGGTVRTEYDIDANNGHHAWWLGGNELLRLTSGGNFGLGTSSFGTSAAKVLAIKNGTAPTSSPAAEVQLWAEPISNSSELRVRDEASNITTLSPHNFSLFEPDPSHEAPWAYYSKNDILGKEVNVDMYGALKEIERLTGKTFIYTRDIPKQDWAANQEAIRLAREAEIAAAQVYNAAIEPARQEALAHNAAVVAGAIEGVLWDVPELAVVPEPYVKKPIPGWIQRALDYQAQQK